MKKTKKVKAGESRRTAAVAELKAGLSAYLALVKAGEEVVVTDRGAPVAKLVPIPPSDDTEVERMQHLAAQGGVRLPTRALPPDFWDRPLPEDPGDSVRKALLEDRASGR